MKIKKYRELSIAIIILIAILSFVILFIVIVTAEQNISNENITTSVVSNASGTGDTVTTLSNANITNNSASGFALSLAKAENGSNASAEASVQVSLLDTASSYAHSVASAVAPIGQAIWVYVFAGASVSENTATSESRAIVSVTEINFDDYGNIIKIPEKADPMPIPEIKQTPVITSTQQSKPTKITISTYGDTSFGGFNFGTNDLQRYCIYKIQLNSENKTIYRRSKYWMNVIATSVEGYHNITEFESRFNITQSNCINILSKK